jgi:Flp pilus assembly protein TadD
MHIVTAQEMDKAGNDEGALEQWERVLKLDPSNLTAPRRLALLYDRRRDFAKADAEYRKLAQANPNDADLFSDWGYSFYLRTGAPNWAEAEKRLRRALEIDPKHVRAHSNLGLVLGQQERYPEAFREFQLAGLSEAEAHCNLAFVYWTKSKYDEAKSECRLAGQLDPSCSKARDMLAQLDKPPQPPGSKERAPREPERVASRPTDGRTPRAATVPDSVWAAERAAAHKAVADRANVTPAPTADQAVHQTSDGRKWVPVSALKPPAGTGHGSPGTITME